jgi:hypothetical protein
VNPREEKIAKARELRAKGLKAREIAERLDANESTVRNWYLGGTCRCGTPLDGSSPGKSTGRCRTCVSADATIWTRETIIEKIREWAAIHGAPPSAYDWCPPNADRAGSPAAEQIRATFEAGNWPGTFCVCIRFGTWNAAIKAAGFRPRAVGVRGPGRVRRKAKGVA